MSEPDLQHILDLIDRLSEDDRELLDERLADRADAGWRGQAEQARRQAKARGIRQAVIDEAVRRRRYGA